MKQIFVLEYVDLEGKWHILFVENYATMEHSPMLAQEKKGKG